MIPADHIIIRAFERGRERGQHRAKYYREQCPYGPTRPFLRDAWFAGYDFAWGAA